MRTENLPDIASLALDFINFTSRNIFLTGGAGTGKTTFLKFLKEHSQKKIAIAAPTGVAAVNAGGTTIHGLFSIPPRSLDENTIKGIRLPAQAKDLLRQLEILVIDEASMLRADVLDLMDQLLQGIRSSNQPMGGLQIVLIGDLYQLPPVERDNESIEGGQLNRYFTYANVFQSLNFLKLELKEVHRQSEKDFVDLLNAIRDGDFTDDQLDEINRRVDPDWQSNESAIVLTTHNRHALRLNEEKINSLPGEEFKFTAEIIGEFPEDQFPVEKTIIVKIGCQVMIIKNDHTADKTFFNGKIGIVTGINDSSMKIAFQDGTIVTMEKETWLNIGYSTKVDDDSIKEESRGSFRQFPVKLGWAITVHKSQGLTFDKAVIDVAEAFAPGQVYVALSRVKSLSGISLKYRIPRTAILSPDIRPSTFSTVDFSKIGELLNSDKGTYFSSRIRYAYGFTELIEVLNKSIFDDAICETLNLSLQKLQRFGTKFADEISVRLSLPESIDWDSFENRVRQASGYFKNELEVTCITPVKQFLNQFKHDFIYRGAVNVAKALEREFKVKLRQIEAINIILVAVKKPIPYKPKFLRISESNQSKLSSNLEIYTREFNTTEEKSLELFLKGKSIAEISQERSLGEPAIQYHLASFIPSGEVTIENIIPPDLLNEAFSLTEQLSDWSIAKLRPLLGNRLSMGQLYGLVIYFNKK